VGGANGDGYRDGQAKYEVISFLAAIHRQAPRRCGVIEDLTIWNTYVYTLSNDNKLIGKKRKGLGSDKKIRLCDVKGI
jgi:hypothetical protein